MILQGGLIIFNWADRSFACKRHPLVNIVVGRVALDYLNRLRERNARLEADSTCSCTLWITHGSLISNPCSVQLACADLSKSRGAFDALQPIYLDTQISLQYVQKVLPPEVNSSILPSAGQPSPAVFAYFSRQLRHL